MAVRQVMTFPYLPLLPSLHQCVGATMGNYSRGALLTRVCLERGNMGRVGGRRNGSPLSWNETGRRHRELKSTRQWNMMLPQTSMNNFYLDNLGFSGTKRSFLFGLVFYQLNRSTPHIFSTHHNTPNWGPYRFQYPVSFQFPCLGGSVFFFPLLIKHFICTQQGMLAGLRSFILTLCVVIISAFTNPSAPRVRTGETYSLCVGLMNSLRWNQMSAFCGRSKQV